ncbi:hypothetical protein [Symbioplanes lichenis]|uniref:hypothetical protein n=1 Tax=Symbioplanes lichenis TaxID=1629072 RepID=UPI002738A2CD|nr:hypothetical protein [Actinoplanes lichenis]
MLVLTLAGCGEVRQRSDAAADVAVGMLTAVAARDGARACEMLAPGTRSELEDSADQGCEQAILDQGLPAPGQVTGSDVYGQWAQVRLPGDTLFLAVFPEGWRVVAAGCEPRTDRPYDCTVQGD